MRDCFFRRSKRKELSDVKVNEKGEIIKFDKIGKPQTKTGKTKSINIFDELKKAIGPKQDKEPKKSNDINKDDSKK